MRILVTGGAGFIGSHVAKALHAAGHVPVVLDNLQAGKREAVQWGPFYQGNIQDAEFVREVLRNESIDAVIHLAGSIEVGESVANPAKYYENNVSNGIALLRSCEAESVMKFVFSSTAAVYGNTKETALVETDALKPVNPYGWSKRFFEQVLLDQAGAQPHFRYTILRYFNACGASGDGEIGENHDPETHLIPRACLSVLGKIPALDMYGTDWPTEDGTPVRDYVHVQDLARAHVLAVERLAGGGENVICNLGTGKGYSVKQILDAVAEVAGKPVPVVMKERRAGDPAVLIANATKAHEVLGWAPEHSDLLTICKTALKWFEKK